VGGMSVGTGHWVSGLASWGRGTVSIFLAMGMAPFRACTFRRLPPDRGGPGRLNADGLARLAVAKMAPQFCSLLRGKWQWHLPASHELPCGPPIRTLWRWGFQRRSH